jgi:hypothetical protein
MTPERFNMLSYRLAPLRQIASVLAQRNGGHLYVLQCGHHTTSAPHFAASKVGSETACAQCGREAVAQHPVYGKEL